MFSLKELPKVPQNTNNTYSHPYKIPKYRLDEFDINFNDFNQECDNEIRNHNEELEEKKSKIKELNMLKALEAENSKKYEQTISQMEEDLLSDSERKKQLKNINKFIGNLENCIADLSKYFLNYHSAKQNALFDKLNSLMYESDLKLSGENENIRSEVLFNEFSSLKPDHIRPSRNKKGK